VDLFNIFVSIFRTDNGKALTNPNLNLLLTSQQVNQKCSSLTTTYRFILYNSHACQYLHKLLKPEIRQGSQYVVKSQIHMFGGKDKTLVRKFNDIELESAKIRCGTSEMSYKSVHVQRNERFQQINGIGMARVDFIITF
jgi:hypothetical protein